MASKSALDANLTPEMKKNLYGDAPLNMMWHCPSDPRFSYMVHVPGSYYGENPPSYRLMVIIHGTGYQAKQVGIYVEEATKFADENNVVLLAPIFPGGLIDPDDFNAYKMLSADGIRYDQILLSMVDDVAARYPGVDTEKFFLFGHSGGGQYSLRFLYVHPERLAGVSVGAPGRPTYLNPDEDYYWGTRDFKKYFDKDPDIAEIAKVPVQLTVGEFDNKFIGDSHYGTNRQERLHSLEKNLQEHGCKTEFVIIKGYEHAGGEKERIGAACDFFLRQL